MHSLLHDEKDIDSIFFYAINENINYLGFFYTANNIKYKKDYKDIDFKQSVDRLIKIYNTLKNEKNIKLIGDLTKDIIEGRITLDKNKIYNKTLINTENYDYLSMIDYIKLIIEHTLKSLNIDIKPYFFVNNKFRYFNEYETKPSYHNIIPIPITFYKYDNGYKLKYKILKETQEYLFDTDIKVFNKSIIVKINNPEYNGEIIFDRLNIDNTIRIKKNNNIIHLHTYDNDLTDEDKEKIRKVFEMIDFNEKINGIKTIDNNYILYNDSKNKEYYMKLSIHDDLIRINLKEYNKYTKDNIDFKPTEEVYDFLITKYDDRNILIQQKYLLSENSSNEFKQNINKSKYFILHTNKDIKTLIDSNLIKKVELDYPIKNINEINKLTYKRS